jgi:hypothetical protein
VSDGDIDLIESAYSSLRQAGGQDAQLRQPITTERIADGFAATVADLSTAKAAGPFFPAGSRTPLIELARDRGPAEPHIRDTEHLKRCCGGHRAGRFTTIQTLSSSSSRAS